jgi:hypothetical protein
VTAVDGDRAVSKGSLRGGDVDQGRGRIRDQGFNPPCRRGHGARG